jgi:ATP-binding cassette subfamily F protein 3
LLVLEPGTSRIIDGNYETYQMLEAKRATEVDSSNRPATSRKSKADVSDDKPQARKRKFPYRKVKDIEYEIEQCEGEIERIHALLIDPEVLRDGRRVKEAKESLETHQSQLELLLEHWEEAIELNG